MAELDCARSVTPVQSDDNCSTEGVAVGKRLRSSPTGCTPTRQEKRAPLRSLANHEAQHEADEAQQESSRSNVSQQLQSTPAGLQPRALINSTGFTKHGSKEKWTEEELKALAEFVLFHTPGESWPAHKNEEFWISASDFIKHRANTPGIDRSGML